MWSKGAVVIVKRGDEAMADAIEQGLNIPEVDNSMIDTTEIENLKRDNYFLRRRCQKTTEEMIEDARNLYGHNWTPPHWANKLVEGFAFIVYLFSVLVDRVMSGR